MRGFIRLSDSDVVRRELRGMTIVFDEESVSESSGKTIHRIIARK
ncbi:MAG: hypothetical protein WDN48_07295 [Pseudolabrys sp.]